MSTTAQHLDIAWILICAALVMLMQAGFSCLESGLVRTKNNSCINVASKNFADFCLSSVLFWLFGFALMFGAINGWFGTSGFLFGDTANPWMMAFFIFQLGFCGITTIVSGAVAERMRFSGYLVAATIISAVILSRPSSDIGPGAVWPARRQAGGWSRWASSTSPVPPWSIPSAGG